MGKPIYQSKTALVAVLAIVLALLFPNLGESVTTEMAIIIESVIFLVLRLVTKEQVFLR